MLWPGLWPFQQALERCFGLRQLPSSLVPGFKHKVLDVPSCEPGEARRTSTVSELRLAVASCESDRGTSAEGQGAVPGPFQYMGSIPVDPLYASQCVHLHVTSYLPFEYSMGLGRPSE